MVARTPAARRAARIAGVGWLPAPPSKVSAARGRLLGPAAISRSITGRPSRATRAGVGVAVGGTGVGVAVGSVVAVAVGRAVGVGVAVALGIGVAVAVGGGVGGATARGLAQASVARTMASAIGHRGRPGAPVAPRPRRRGPAALNRLPTGTRRLRASWAQPLDASADRLGNIDRPVRPGRETDRHSK